MKIRVSLLFIVIALWAMPAGATVYQDSTFRIGVFQGWDILDPSQEYTFQGVARYERDDVFDFFVDQNDLFEATGERFLDYDALKTSFSDNYTPLLISILITEELDQRLPLAISSISTDSNVFRGNMLKAWEYRYSIIGKSIGPYYSLNGVPLNTRYEMVFLLPSILVKDSQISVTFTMGLREAVTTAPSDVSNVESRVELLRDEIERLESFK